jgi:2-iminobutanoate/2-iminopropanoate deaminase
MRQIINAEGAPRPKAPVSHAVRSGHLIFVSGITPFNHALELAVGDFDAQFHQTFDSIEAILKSVDSGLNRIVKCNVLLARRQDWPRMNELYASLWPDGNYPARTAIEAVLPHPDFLIEIECVAEAAAHSDTLPSP